MLPGEEHRMVYLQIGDEKCRMYTRNVKVTSRVDEIISPICLHRLSLERVGSVEDLSEGSKAKRLGLGQNGTTNIIAVTIGEASFFLLFFFQFDVVFRIPEPSFLSFVLDGCKHIILVAYTPYCHLLLRVIHIDRVYPYPHMYKFN